MVPSPSSPYRFEPQAQAVPSERTATVSYAPADTWVIPVRPGTGAGLKSSAVLPLPS